MNDPELDALLKRARTPQPSAEFWQDLPRQLTVRLNRARSAGPAPARKFFPGLTWAFATAVCVLVAFVAGHWHGRRGSQPESAPDVLANVKMVSETLAMFPDRVRAIVQDNAGLRLVLSDSNNIPISMPLYVHICDGKQCASVVTFSGQEIQVGGQKLTVLSDSANGIILMGNDFAWSSREPAYAKNDLKIEAKVLDLKTM